MVKRLLAAFSITNVKSKTVKALRYALPDGVLSRLIDLVYAFKAAHRRITIETMDRTEGFFEVPTGINGETAEYYLRLDQRPDFDFYSHGPPQPESSILRTVLNAGDVFYDIGAYVGFFSVPAAQIVGEQGTVYSVEPDETNAEILEKTLEHNQLQQVTSLNLALGETSGTREMYHSSNPATHSLAPDKDETFFLGSHHQTGERTTVRTVRLDDLVETENLAEPDLIKIDAEGAEVGVLRGMKQLIQLSTPVILLSVHENKLPAFNTSPHELYDLIEETNYRPFYLTASGRTEPIESPPFEALYELVLRPE